VNWRQVRFVISRLFLDGMFVGSELRSLEGDSISIKSESNHGLILFRSGYLCGRQSGRRRRSDHRVSQVAKPENPRRTRLGGIGKEFQVDSLPQTVIIDQDGNAAFVKVGNSNDLEKKQKSSN